MGAKAICMKNTLDEKRAAVYWFRRLEGISSDRTVLIVRMLSRASREGISQIATCNAGP
jgi:hypothetical protein